MISFCVIKIDMYIIMHSFCFIKLILQIQEKTSVIKFSNLYHFLGHNCYLLISLQLEKKLFQINSENNPNFFIKYVDFFHKKAYNYVEGESSPIQKE